MKLLLLTIALSIHGIIFTDEMTLASKTFGLCILIAIGLYILAKKAIKETDEYK